eukprot:SAG31_NODE_10734_length_1104_cov_1.165174_1_plen_232_part_10
MCGKPGLPMSRTIHPSECNECSISAPGATTSSSRPEEPGRGSLRRPEGPPLRSRYPLVASAPVRSAQWCGGQLNGKTAAGRIDDLSTDESLARIAAYRPEPPQPQPPQQPPPHYNRQHEQLQMIQAANMAAPSMRHPSALGTMSSMQLMPQPQPSESMIRAHDQHSVRINPRGRLEAHGIQTPSMSVMLQPQMSSGLVPSMPVREFGLAMEKLHQSEAQLQASLARINGQID